MSIISIKINKLISKIANDKTIFNNLMSTIFNSFFILNNFDRHKITFRINLKILFIKIKKININFSSIQEQRLLNLLYRFSNNFCELRQKTRQIRKIKRIKKKTLKNYLIDQKHKFTSLTKITQMKSLWKTFKKTTISSIIIINIILIILTRDIKKTTITSWFFSFSFKTRRNVVIIQLFFF